MLRNKQEQKLKFLRKLDQRIGELGHWEVEYVPVDKPYQIGWTVHIALSDSGRRRKDADTLQKVLDICGASKKEQTRSLRFLRYLRIYKRVGIIGEEIKNNTSYKTKISWPYWFKGLSGFYIDRHQYLNLPYEVRKYFVADMYYKYSYWTGKEDRHTKYHIHTWKFPRYELVYKIEKCYATHQGIPRGDDWSEYVHIHNTLYNSHYWCAKNGNSAKYTNYEIRHQNITDRRSWKYLCHSFKNSDFSYEAEEQIMKYLKNQKRKW